MASENKSRPSFSAASRWQIGFDIVVRTLLVIAVAVMANSLGNKFYHRFYLSSQSRIELASRTLSVLHTVTNRVDVTLYYDTHDQNNFFPTVQRLINAYHDANPQIIARAVDYNRDAGEAARIKDKYHLTSQSDKDLIIFDSGGHVKVFPGDALVLHTNHFVGMTPKLGNSKEGQMEWERRPVAFNGEEAFTSMLLALSSPQPLKAYFTQHHGESLLSDSDNDSGFQKFASVLGENYISTTNLDWIGDAGVPADCNLLIIAGPTQPFTESELQGINQYLQEGGRLFVLFNYQTQAKQTGLEPILQRWGVAVMPDLVSDPEHTMSKGYDVVVDQFRNHPVVNALSQVRLQLWLPRPILKLPPSQAANAPDVSELFATGPNAVLLGNRAEPAHQYPLACAVEQKPVAGVSTPRGNTRIIVTGDSFFVGNKMIQVDGNRDFLNASLNWLCDRPLLLQGIGPRPVTEFRLQITQHQQQSLRWILLLAVPGGVLILGWLVWLVRRK